MTVFDKHGSMHFVIILLNTEYTVFLLHAWGTVDSLECFSPFLQSDCGMVLSSSLFSEQCPSPFPESSLRETGDTGTSWEERCWGESAALSPVILEAGGRIVLEWDSRGVSETWVTVEGIAIRHGVEWDRRAFWYCFFFFFKAYSYVFMHVWIYVYLHEFMQVVPEAREIQIPTAGIIGICYEPPKVWVLRTQSWILYKNNTCS